MNREILFKAKRIDNREWIEGYIGKRTIMPVKKPGRMAHLGTTIERIPTGIFLEKSNEVDPATVCQYTGFEDVKGVKAFENDIVFCEETGVKGTIVFANGCYEIKWQSEDEALREDIMFWFTQRRMHVIGNVFDDKEDSDD